MASDIVFSLETPINGLPATAGNGAHVAFQAPDRETVRRFHAAALANGAVGHQAFAKITTPTTMAHSFETLMDNKIEAVTFTARESF
jgi:hypothetical protein